MASGVRTCLLLWLMLVGTVPVTAQAEPWLWGAAGDSLTAAASRAYPDLLEGPERKLQVVAQPGGRLRDLLDRQVPALVSCGATLVTVCIGTNDVMQPLACPGRSRLTAENFERGLEWAIAFLQASDDRRRIIVATLPHLEEFPRWQVLGEACRANGQDLVTAYNGAIRRVALRRRCTLWQFPALPPQLFLNDGLHPDAAGQRLLASSLRPLLPSDEGPAPRPLPVCAFPSPCSILPSSGRETTADGTWIGILRRGQGTESILRLDLEEGSGHVRGRALKAQQNRLHTFAVEGTWEGRVLKLTAPGRRWSLDGRLLEDGRTLRLDGRWSGRIERLTSDG